MDNVSNMTGTPLTVKIKDKEYTVSQLTIDDLAAFEQFIRSNRIKMFRDGSEGMDEAEKNKEIKNILRSPITDEDISQEMISVSGVRFLLYRMLKSNPGVKLENMGQIIGLDNLSEAITVLNLYGTPERPPQPAEAASQ